MIHWSEEARRSPYVVYGKVTNIQMWINWDTRRYLLFSSIYLVSEKISSVQHPQQKLCWDPSDKLSCVTCFACKNIRCDVNVRHVDFSEPRDLFLHFYIFLWSQLCCIKSEISSRATRNAVLSPLQRAYRSQERLSLIANERFWNASNESRKSRYLTIVGKLTSRCNLFPNFAYFETWNAEQSLWSSLPKNCTPFVFRQPRKLPRDLRSSLALWHELKLRLPSLFPRSPLFRLRRFFKK